MRGTTTDGGDGTGAGTPAAPGPGGDLYTVFPGETEMARRCRALDWAATPLGPVGAWPASQRTAAQIVLAAAFPHVLLWGPDLVQLYNDGYCALMGAKHPAGLGQPTRACWPEVWHLNAPIYERVRAGETVLLEDALFPITRSGATEDAWFTLSYSPVWDAAAVGGVLVAVFETTARVRARGALEVERERLLGESEAARRQVTATLESIGDAFYAVDRDFRFTYVNRRAEQLWGRRREELLGRHYWTEFPQAVGSESYRRHLEVMAERRPAHYETVSPLLSRWVDVSLYPDEVSGGLACYFRDVTERRQAEAALRESEARLRRAMDIGGITVWERDLRTDRLDAAAPPAGRDGAPLVHADALGDYQGFLAAVHPEDRERVARANADAVAGGGELAVTYRITGADGSLRWHETLARVLRDEAGAPARVVGVSLDVTERVALEERLRLAQRMEAVGQLAGGVAHDFNNLLTVISGNLEFVQHDLPPDHPVRPDLDEIATAALRAHALVRQLLTFSRRQPVRPRLVQVGAVVAEAERLLRRVIGEEIAVHVYASDAGAQVLADPGQLEQVLLNLGVNARDAMLTPRHGHPGTGGTLTIDVAPIELGARDAAAWDGLAPGRYVRLTVRDTGHGMDEATRARAFEPFFTTKEVGQGTGLGLATVHGIVRQVGGAVRIESAPGAGTTVAVLLPVADASPDGAPEPGARPGAAGAGATLLVVEDEAPVRAVLRRTLERHGYAVLEAQHGADALLLWRAHRDRVAAVRADRPTLPVVYVSGYAHDAAEVRADVGARFLEKPFAADALLDALRSLLRDAGAGPPAPDDPRMP